MKHHGFFAPLALIGISLICGSSFIIIKSALAHFNAVQVAMLRLAVGGLCVWPIAWHHRSKVRAQDARVLLFMGVTGAALPAILFALALKHISSATVGVLSTMTPFWVLVLGTWIFTIRPPRLRWLGVAIGFIGAFILIAFSSNGHLTLDNAYALCIVLAVIGFASNCLLIQKKLAHLPPVVIASTYYTLILPITIPLFVLSGGVPASLASSAALLSGASIAALGIASNAIGYIFYAKLIQRTSASYASMAYYIIPVVAMGWGLLSGESLGVNHLYGIPLIALGIYLSTMQVKKRQRFPRLSKIKIARL